VKRKTVLIVSSDSLFADAAEALLDSMGWQVVGTARDGVRALAVVERDSPDRILLLGHPKRLRAESFVRQLSRREPGPSVVMLAFDEDAPEGALPRTTSATELMASLEAPPGMSIGQGRAPSGMGLLSTLTPRERAVLRLLARGWSRYEVAAALGVAPNTVRTHTQRVYAKLRLHSAADLARFAVRQGLVDPKGASSLERPARGASP
jgi:two-component system nitrate/nitrite response regulator NarL